MKSRLMNFLAATLLCGAMSAHAIPLVFTTALNGVNESPPTGSPGTGTASVTIDELLHTMRVQSSFTGLVGTTLAAHIHCCTLNPGGTGPVATTVPTFPGFPGGVTAGSYDSVFDMYDPASYNPSFLVSAGGSAAGAFTTLVTGIKAGFGYFNIHSTAYPGGEIRGFLAPAQTAVPLPGTLLLLVVGLGGIAWRGRRGCAQLTRAR